MTWEPAEKKNSNVKVIRLTHTVAKEITGVALPDVIVFGWKQFVLSVSRTRGMQVQVEGPSQQKRERYWTRYGAYIAGAINVFIDETTQELSFDIALNTLP